MLTMNTHRKDRNGGAIILYALNTNTALLQRKLFYHSHISPHLTYTSTVWDGCSDILFNKLNSLHRRAAKLMISDSSLTTDTKLQYLGLLRLKEKLIFNKAVLVFKAYKILAPPYREQFLSVPPLAPHLDSR